MNAAIVKPGRLVGVLTALCIGAAAIASYAQTSPTPNPVITIDGQKDPDKVPEWILWREAFRLAIHLADTAPSQGKELWVDAVGMSMGSMARAISAARDCFREEGAREMTAKSLVSPGRIPSDSVMASLKKLDGERQESVLRYRDALRSAMSAAEYSQLASWLRIHMAPTIKVGEMFPGKNTVGVSPGVPPKH
jgi:hypothetical protein